MIKVNESKQVGVLYHYTSIENLLSILSENRLRIATVHTEKGISLTRDKNFHRVSRNLDWDLDVRISLDGNKLSEKYKIEPYDYFAEFPDEGYYEEPYQYKNLEAEERILGRDIADIRKYIIRLDLIGESFFAERYPSDIMNKMIYAILDKFDDAYPMDRIGTKYVQWYLQEKYPFPCDIIKGTRVVD